MHRALIRFDSRPAVSPMNASLIRRIYEPPTCSSAGLSFLGGSVKLCEWLTNSRSLVSHFSPDFFLSSSTHPYASPCGVCLLTFIPDNVESNLLASNSGITSKQQVSDSPHRHPLHMARSRDNLLVWQAPDIQGSASGALVRDLFRPSVAW